MCVRELKTEQNCNILTPTLLAITAFFAVLLGCSTEGLGAQPLWVVVFSTATCLQLLWSPNWLNFLCTVLYDSLTPTFLWASQIALIQPIHSQGYTLPFLDRMHLLFTQVYFLFWQSVRVVGQYTTLLSQTSPAYRFSFHADISIITLSPLYIDLFARTKYLH